MTVAALTSSREYNGNGVTTVFAAPFRYLAPTDLAVTRVNADATITTLAYGADYAATAGPTDAGGAVTCTVAPAVGTVLRIKRATPRSQGTDYTTGDEFPAEAHEAALDRAMLVDQEQDDKIDDTAARALLVPDGETAATIPAAAARAGLFLAFDGAGAPVVASGTGADAGLRVDLAASTGAALVGVIKGWSGAVLRSLADWFEDQPSIMDAIPLVERVKIRLRTSNIDLATYVQKVADAYPLGAVIAMPAGTYTWSKVTITSKNLSFRGAGKAATTLKKYGAAGAGGDSIGERGMFIVKNLLDAGLRISRCTFDLNGEGPKGIGVAGRIANSYAPQTLPAVNCIAGPANAAVFGLRASGIELEDVEALNTGESAFLFRNCAKIKGRRISGSNVANMGIEFSFVAAGSDGGSGTMPDRCDVDFDTVHFEDIEDLGLGSGNAMVIGGGGAAAMGAFRNYRFHNITGKNVYRGVHFEFQAGSYLKDFGFTGLYFEEVGQNAFGLIGAHDGLVEGQAVNVGKPAAVALCYQQAATYPDVCGGVLSTDHSNVTVRFKVTDTRSGGVVYRADGVATALNAVFTSAGANFQPGDVGKAFACLGAGPGGNAHVTTIAGRASTTSITLTDVPRTTVAAAAKFAYGGACREPLIVNGGASATLLDCDLEGGVASGLTAEPAANAVRLQAVSERVRVARMRLKPSANGGTWPCGLRVVDAFAGRADLDPDLDVATGFTDKLVGAYTRRGSIVPRLQSFPLDRAISPGAGISTYGTEELVYADTTSFTGPLAGSVEALGAFGAETVTFTLTAYFYDGTASATPADLTFTAVQTQQFTARHHKLVNPDGAMVRAFGVKMKSTIAGSTVTGKVNGSAPQL